MHIPICKPSQNLLFPSLLIAALGMAPSLFAQREAYSTVDSLDKKMLNWQHLDLKAHKTAGIGTDKAYRELLSSLTPKQTVVVAVIDAGVDIAHEDLNGKVWTNKGEIPANGIDDDGNGYIDDVHGWNFIGNAKGENIEYENVEYTRILRKLKPEFEKYANADKVPADKKDGYALYLQCKAKYDTDLKKYESQKQNIEGFEQRLAMAESALRETLQADQLSIPSVKALKTKDKRVLAAKKMYLAVYQNGYTPQSLNSYKEHINKQLDTYLNFEFNPRTLLGDNVEDINDRHYGNNDVTGPDAFHGTFVAGIIAANRGNRLGIDGIAENVLIMSVRAVPEGDEMDKDVALAIRYAVDNGAKVINMSFGKAFSPQKQMVDEALKYAESKGVLLVHGAGNDAQDVDAIPNYPNKFAADGYQASNWLNVGANAYKKDKTLPAVFSNYGQQNVDLFAPGVNMVSLTTQNRYQMSDGTSFACPMVAGAAALIWSYYPNLSVQQLREIILRSATPFPKLKVNRPSENRGKKKKDQVYFGSLSQTGGLLNIYEALKLAATY
ncbi:MAG: S8 family serine peptidase [Breznakibacter sp.]